MLIMGQEIDGSILEMFGNTEGLWPLTFQSLKGQGSLIIEQTAVLSKLIWLLPTGTIRDGWEWPAWQRCVFSKCFYGCCCPGLFELNFCQLKVCSLAFWLHTHTLPGSDSAPDINPGGKKTWIDNSEHLNKSGLTRQPHSEGWRSQRSMWVDFIQRFCCFSLQNPRWNTPLCATSRSSASDKPQCRFSGAFSPSFHVLGAPAERQW